MQFKKGSIIIERELSELDKFTLGFIIVLRKHTSYVLVSGYVSILLGRSRSSEDVDVLIPKMEKHVLGAMVSDLLRAGFYCLNTESLEDILDYLNEGLPVRFAKTNTAIPNMELKFIKNRIQELALREKLTVDFGSDVFFISPLELQIAFKEKILKSQKDREDAEHLRMVAKDHLDLGLIKKYGMVLDGFY